jgi:hypothetical protein
LFLIGYAGNRSDYNCSSCAKYLIRSKHILNWNTSFFDLIIEIAKICWWEKSLVVALIPIAGDSAPPCGTVVFMIIAQRRLSTLTQYLTWFGKLPTSMEEIDIIRDRERIQHTEKDHIHLTPISHCYIGQQLHTAAGLLVATLLFFFLFFSLLFLLSLSLCCILGVYL